MKKLNNKGFTLIEVIAVLVILTAIMGIAIPTINSSIERSKEKQNEEKKKILVSFAEVYVSENKNVIYKNLEDRDICYISVKLLETEGYLSDDANKDANDKEINGYIIFNKSNNSYKYSTETEGNACDISGENNVPTEEEGAEPETVFLNNKTQGKYVYYNESGNWRIAYHDESGSTHLISNITFGKKKDLEEILYETSGFCNINYSYQGTCSSATIWPMGIEDFNKITGKKIDECSAAPATENCLNNSLLESDKEYLLVSSDTEGYFLKISYWTTTPINSYGYRIVVKLDPSIIVTDGNGTQETPYRITKGN